MEIKKIKIMKQTEEEKQMSTIHAPVPGYTGHLRSELCHLEVYYEKASLLEEIQFESAV